MFTDYNVRRRKLSFSYNIPYRFPKNSELAIGENALLQQRSNLLVKYLNGQCVYENITDIDKKISHQRYVNNHNGNCYLFSQPTLKNYDADFLEMFANAYLNIDAYDFFRYTPIFEIENVKIYAYMPDIDKFGNAKTDKDGACDVIVTVEIRVVTVDMKLEDFENYAKCVFGAVSRSGKEVRNCKTDDLGEVEHEYCEIIEKIEECRNETKLYGYKDTPRSPVVRWTELLETVENPEFARRLYCGKVWTSDGLKFADHYYNDQK